ncbi:hypothetical protein RHMOL_Rhmol06G0051500 [Rhododendron molle]|uniref:Uncharacterized protein n=1 Tax=Rhododendron molle TaxID=49168 RepID=A0ACC0NAE0_RHOML|nr:hypothetical protein RHMOL_Rhmol06G0051500 [Rhododendron molle]
MGGSGLKNGIRGLWGADSGCGKQRVVLKSSLGEVNAVRRLLVDGVWDKMSCEGAVAWCSVGDGEEVRNDTWCSVGDGEEVRNDRGSCRLICASLGF